ncbi:MAG TPA: hypothetical protein VGI39_41430 [Polyangiaceae bacterium]|jgi:uncharacterized membrane protein
MGWIYLVSVWLHVLAATAWIGSMLFFAAVIVPAMRDPAAAAGSPLLLQIVGRRYRVFGWASLGTLLVTGITNLWFRGIRWALLTDGEFWTTGFGRALAWKLAFIVLVLAATTGHDLWMGTAAVKRALADRASPAAKRYRRGASLLGRSTLILSLVVLFFAIELVRGAP